MRDGGERRTMDRLDKRNEVRVQLYDVEWNRISTHWLTRVPCVGEYIWDTRNSTEIPERLPPVYEVIRVIHMVTSNCSTEGPPTDSWGDVIVRPVSTARDFHKMKF